jgi:hypothetical protein
VIDATGAEGERTELRLPWAVAGLEPAAVLSDDGGLEEPRAFDEPLP